MLYVYQRELLESLRRAGGPLGLGAVAVACAGLAIGALRLRSSLFDPVILLALTAIGLVFSANFAAGAFANEREQGRLINGDGIASDREMIFGKTLAAATFGLVSWAVAMGCGISTLDGLYQSFYIPWLRLGALAMFTFAACLANASFASSMALRMGNESAARRLVRGPGLLMVLLLVIGPRFLPDSIGGPILSTIRGGRLSSTVLILSALLIPLALFFLRRTEVALDERRHPLSIVEKEA